MKTSSSNHGEEPRMNNPRIHIVFKNLERSELVENIAHERIGDIIQKFPDLDAHNIRLTLSMENSPQQAGPDVFTVKIIVRGRKYRNLIIEKSAPNLYLALADLKEHLLERLNRLGDRERVVKRSQKRRLLSLKKQSGLNSAD